MVWKSSMLLQCSFWSRSIYGGAFFSSLVDTTASTNWHVDIQCSRNCPLKYFCSNPKKGGDWDRATIPLSSRWTKWKWKFCHYFWIWLLTFLRMSVLDTVWRTKVLVRDSINENVKAFTAVNRSIHQHHSTYFQLVTYDIWDTDYNTDNLEPGFMKIFVTWQSIVTLDSIRNSCEV